jgi:hypothetical protein
VEEPAALDERGAPLVKFPRLLLGKRQGLTLVHFSAQPAVFVFKSTHRMPRKALRVT